MASKFPCRINDPKLKAFMMRVKTSWNDFIPEATERFSRLQTDVTKYWKTAEIMTPDIPWIKEFIEEAYVHGR